jgi:predicted dehydrogenase
MSKSRVSRREFMGRTLGAAGVGAGFAIGGTKSTGRVLGANETVRVAVAGLNGRGASHVGEFAKMPGVAIAYLIDPDTRTYQKRLDQIEDCRRQVEKKGGQACTQVRDVRTVQDVRRALDDKSVDAVSVATPNHWHALFTIWGCQAG